MQETPPCGLGESVLTALSAHVDSLQTDTAHAIAMPAGRYHVDSSDTFMANDLPQIIETSSRLSVTTTSHKLPEVGGAVTVTCTFGSPVVGVPEWSGDSAHAGQRMAPQQAVLMQATYAAPVHVPVDFTIYRPPTELGGRPVEQRMHEPKHLVCNMPVMVGSAKCTRYDSPAEGRGPREGDQVGTFVIKGSEKMIPWSEEARYNAPIVLDKGGGKFTLQVHSVDPSGHKHWPLYLACQEKTFPCGELQRHRPVMLLNCGLIKEPVNVVLVFLALGAGTLKATQTLLLEGRSCPTQWTEADVAVATLFRGTLEHLDALWTDDTKPPSQEDALRLLASKCQAKLNDGHDGTHERQ